MGKSLEPSPNRDEKKAKRRKRKPPEPFFISTEEQFHTWLRGLYPYWKVVITTERESPGASAGVEVDDKSVTPKISMEGVKLKQTISLEPVDPPDSDTDPIDITPETQ